MILFNDGCVLCRTNRTIHFLQRMLDRKTKGRSLCATRLTLRQKHGVSATKIHGEHRILYFGSDCFSIGPLTHLLNRLSAKHDALQQITCLDVVYSLSRTKTKGKRVVVYPLVHSYMEKTGLHGIDWADIIKDPECIAERYDFGIVASFGHLIPENIMKQFQRGMLNIHPSVLPRWRGSAPIEHTILNGDKVTGVSIIELSVGRFDHGRILAQRELTVAEGATTESLTQELSNASGPLLTEVLDDFDHFHENARRQEDEGKTYAKKIKKEMGRIIWSEHSMDYIDRLYRAIGGKVGLYSTWRSKRVKLLDIKKSSPDESIQNIPFGVCKFIPELKCLSIRCSDGWINVMSLHVEYKTVISADRFYKSYVKDTIRDGISTVLFQ